MRATLPALVGILFVAGCSSPSGWELADRVSRMGTVLVQLERRAPDAEPVAPFAHPARVARIKLADFFMNATYVRHGDSKPVVHVERAPLLARSIAEGLAKADPTTRVRFQVDNPAPLLGVFDPGGTSRGVAFVQPAGTLNIVFDVVDDIIEFEDDTWADPVREGLSHGEIRPPAGARRRIAENGEPEPWWVEMKVDPTAPVAVTTTPLPATNEPVPTAPPGTKPALTESQVLDRLRYLEELHDRGSISTEEYRRQRKALLTPQP